MDWAIKISNYFDISVGDFIPNDYIHNNRKTLPSSDEEYIQILKKKGLIDKNDNLTEKDAKTVRELAKIANIDVEKYGLEMLKAGTNLDKYTEDELIRLDAKKIEKEDVKYIIAQVNTVSIPDVLKRKAKIEEEMNKEILAKGLSLFVFVITDIVNSNSEAIVLGDRVDAISKTYEIKDNIAVMPGVVSRKKQILPLVEKNI